jgi:hypothetical protein
LEKAALARRIGTLQEFSMQCNFYLRVLFSYRISFSLNFNCRCLKKYCACVADGLPCDDDRCSCIECENTVLARMSKRMKVNEDSASSATKLLLVIDGQENDQDAIVHTPAATLAATATSTHEASLVIDDVGQIVTVPLMSDELTPVRYPTIEV